MATFTARQNNSGAIEIVMAYGERLRTGDTLVFDDERSHEATVEIGHSGEARVRLSGIDWSFTVEVVRKRAAA